MRWTAEPVVRMASRFARRSFWLLLPAACLFPAVPMRKPGPFPQPEPLRAKLLFAGDLMQHMPQIEAARRDTAFDYAPVFELLLPRFRAADLVVVNLETTLTRSNAYAGYPCFRSPAALAGAMRDAGIDVAVQANNHCCDGGDRGIAATCAELDRAGIRRTGVFTDSLDRAARHPLLLCCNSIRFALLNYTYGTNGIPVPAGRIVNTIDTLRMAADLAAARAAAADCIVVCIHWGNEYERRENEGQRRIARFLRRQGVDLVVGSHPHVVQPVEADSTHAVIYSLGNFVSNQRQRYTDGGILAGVDVVKHPDGRMTYALEIVPVWVSLPGYRLIPPEAGGAAASPAAYRMFREDIAALLGKDI